MYIISIFEVNKEGVKTPVRIVAPTSFNIELKGKFINFFDEENKCYQTEHFDKVHICTENQAIILYRYIKE